MTGKNYIPTEKIADFVDSILVVENNDVKKPFSLPLFANGKPTLLFQTTKGTIKSSSNYLTLFGQTILPEQITFAENFTLIAFFFKPFALTTLFGFSAQDLTDNPINLNLIQPPNASLLQEKLLNSKTVDEMVAILDDFIFTLTTKIKTDNKLIKYATNLIAENPSKEILKKVQDELYVTERTFQRMFEDKVGLSPNQYRRIAQFNSAFQQLNQHQFKLFSDIAFNNVYADQSHFIRAFKEFTNMTPKEYLKLGKGE
ncbi:helix-turn-helix domain-containing protein [Cecembia rubra]|uniref:AraC-like DNA-binding protein n=1 Tax=Cecembia rubra TaxID=1485585 RepID=A0A2P8E1N1_9BACT|nr:helix-turn-helix domain-containing protein [Cecembia rubra]PSL03383.1 AraC-like DNA-binding protein [Cecembia rubra]